MRERGGSSGSGGGGVVMVVGVGECNSDSDCVFGFTGHMIIVVHSSTERGNFCGGYLKLNIP